MILKFFDFFLDLKFNKTIKETFNKEVKLKEFKSHRLDDEVNDDQNSLKIASFRLQTSINLKRIFCLKFFFKKNFSPLQFVWLDSQLSYTTSAIERLLLLHPNISFIIKRKSFWHKTALNSPNLEIRLALRKIKFAFLVVAKNLFSERPAASSSTSNHFPPLRIVLMRDWTFLPSPIDARCRRKVFGLTLKLRKTTLKAKFVFHIFIFPQPEAEKFRRKEMTRSWIFLSGSRRNAWRTIKSLSAWWNWGRWSFSFRFPTVNAQQSIVTALPIRSRFPNRAGTQTQSKPRRLLPTHHRFGDENFFFFHVDRLIHRTCLWFDFASDVP